MNVYEKIFVGIALILIIAAVVVMVIPVTGQQDEEIDETTLEGLRIINTSVNMGKDAGNYTYSFAEKSNGYTETYVLVRNGNEQYVETDDILSVKKVYFMENDTVLCIDYMEVSRCSSTNSGTDSRLKQYYTYLKSKFFDDAGIANENRMINELFNGGYIKINSVSDEEINGHSCRMVNYVIDYRDMSLTEAGKYGISPSSPKYFEWQLCADDEKVYYKYFTYTYGGKLNEWEFTLYEFTDASDIEAPETLEEGAYSILVEQMEKKGELTSCLNQKAGDERDRCIAKIALDIYSEELCGITGDRRDRCLISLMPFLLDEAICEKIIDASFKDDCYIEMAGGKKDSSYCENIVNESKTDLCTDVSREDYGMDYEPESNETMVNETMTNVTVDINETEDTDSIIEDIFEQIENSTEEN